MNLILLIVDVTVYFEHPGTTFVSFEYDVIVVFSVQR